MKVEDLYPSRIEAKPVVTARRDPVVYSDWSPDAPLSREQTESFRKNGFLALENAFDTSEIAVLQEEAARLAAGKIELEPETAITEPGSGAVRSVFKIHEQSGVFWRLSSDARLAEVAKFLLGDDIYVHQSRLNYKPGFNGKEFYWHSDFETWHVEDGMPRMRAVSMSVLLNENTPVNGPTMFIPGSHESYIACVGETPEDHYKQSLKKQEYGVPDANVLAEMARASGVAMPTGPAGTVVIFDCNTMHGSNSNITPFPRSNAFLVFNAVSNRLVAPFGPKKPRPDFIAAREKIAAVKPVSGRIGKEAA
ncbi:MAG: ectoine hydroxylase [Pseudomonadota bacterium]|nr:ectoine hydroxylase [Pseudomonadota bacterium]